MVAPIEVEHDIVLGSGTDMSWGTGEQQRLPRSHVESPGHPPAPDPEKQRVTQDS